MQPLQLSDDEMTALYRAAQPIAPHLRDEFLQAVAAALVGQKEIGPGVVFRVIRDQQKNFSIRPIRHPIFKSGTAVTAFDAARSELAGDRSPR